MNHKVIKRSGVQLVVEYHAGAVIEPDVDNFISGLNDMMDGGAQFRPGQTFQMGWSTMRFVPLAASSGAPTLAFEELDGSGVAGQWARGVSRTLIATRLQRSVVESFNLHEDQMDFPKLAQSSIICNEIDPDGALFMHRLDPTNRNDSGWFFSCQSETHDHNNPALLECDSLYVHACRVQAVLPFLALPVGCRVLLAADGSVEEAYDPSGRALQVVPGSYLAERRGRTSRG